MMRRWAWTIGPLGFVLGVTGRLAMTTALALPEQATQSDMGQEADATNAVYLPFTLRDGRPAAAPTGETVTATVTPSPTSPVATATTPPAEGPRGPVVLQITTYGGLSVDVVLGWLPSQAPWFTLYDNGTYIRARRSADGGLDPYDWVVGRLTAEQMAARVAQFTDEAHFFDLSDRPWALRCMTDQADTYVTLQSGGRSHRVVVYALEGYLDGQRPCPSPPGTPEREASYVALAHAVDELTEPQTGEQAYEVQQAMFIVSRVSRLPETPPPPWNVGLRLADVAGAGGSGQLPLEGALARQVLEAVVAARRRFQPVAEFREDERDYVVGLRVEVPAIVQPPADATP